MGCSKQQVYFILIGCVGLSVVVYEFDKIDNFYVHIRLPKNQTTRIEAEKSKFARHTVVLQDLKPCYFNVTQSKKHVSPESRQELIASDPTFLHYVKQGGSYLPLDCKANINVALIVPYRDREKQLPIFLRHMHHFLQTQKIAYTIFIIEMKPGDPFNRGLLMNIGFQVATRSGNFTCFIFHDVDLLPTNESNLYSCQKKVRLLSTGNSKNKYKIPYPSYFGGVVSFTEKQYRKVNGFSNLYFGWGLEDDDLLIRVSGAFLQVSRLDPTVGRYEAQNHSAPKFYDNPLVPRKELKRTIRIRRLSEGVNSVLYKELGFELRDMYTWVLVETNKTDLHSRYLLCNKMGWPCDFKHIDVQKLKAKTSAAGNNAMGLNNKTATTKNTSVQKLQQTYTTANNVQNKHPKMIQKITIVQNMEPENSTAKINVQNKQAKVLP